MNIHYPLYITIDTNIINENKYDFSESGTLFILSKYVAQGKVKVILSNIVCNEVKRHLSKRAKEITSKINNALKDLRKSTSDSFIETIGYADRIQKQDAEIAEKKAIGCFENYLLAINAEILNNKDVDSEKIFNDYFCYNPPFEDNDKKREEFPDAFIAAQIRMRFGSDQVVAIVGKDKGFRDACGKAGNHIFFDSLGDLYDEINKQDQHNYDETINLICDNKAQIVDEIRELLLDDNNVKITGQTVDRDGIIDGNDYEEVYIEAVRNILYSVHTVDQITEEKVIATLDTQASITAYCTYNDYDNAIWDSEEKKYAYIDTIELREKHHARFSARVEIAKESGSVNVKTGIVLLGPSTRTAQENLSYEEYLMDIEDQDRESCGLRPLKTYKNYLEDDFINSQIKMDVCTIFEKINQISLKYEEADCIYNDLLDTFNQNSKSIINKLIPLSRNIDNFPCKENSGNLSQKSIDAIREWLNNKIEEMSYMADSNHLPDDFSFGDIIQIKDENEIYTFSIESLDDLFPEADQEEKIVLTVHGNDINTEGFIKITEGYRLFGHRRG